MFPGMPGGPGGGAFDFAALQQALNVSHLTLRCCDERICDCAKLDASDPFHNAQDPNIKAMAEQIANDPSFKEVTKTMQESFGGMMQGGGAGAAPPDLSSLDPSKYMNAMSGMFQNPSFMQMAEKLGQTIIQV